MLDEEKTNEEKTEERHYLDYPLQMEMPLETGHAKAILEGLLFIVGDDGITVEQAMSALEISRERVEILFDDLMKEYASDDNRGIEIANYGGTYRFLSKAIVHDYAKKLFQMNKQATLSQAALETLAIIAYKQPVTKAEIERVRGVSSEHAVNKLVEYDLVCEVGRLDAPGRPMLFGTTEEFLRSFGVSDIKDLPEPPEDLLEKYRKEAEEEAGAVNKDNDDIITV